MSRIVWDFMTSWLPWILLAILAWTVAGILIVARLAFCDWHRSKTGEQPTDAPADPGDCEVCRPGGTGRCTCTSVCLDYADCVGDYTTRSLFSPHDLRWLRKQKIGAGE